MTLQDTITELKALLAKHESNLDELDVKGFIQDAISDAESAYADMFPATDYGTASGESDEAMRRAYAGRL